MICGGSHLFDPFQGQLFQSLDDAPVPFHDLQEARRVLTVHPDPLCMEIIERFLCPVTVDANAEIFDHYDPENNR